MTFNMLVQQKGDPHILTDVGHHNRASMLSLKYINT